MNVRITRFLKTTGMLLATGVLLGCEGKSAKLAQAGAADTPSPVAASTNTPPATNQTAAADLEAEPLRKIEPTALPMSAGVEDIIKLAQSGVGDAVILAYIENSSVAYELGADDITYLNDVGVSDDVMKAMIEHGSKLREQEQKAIADKIDKSVVAAKQSLADDLKNQPATPVASAQTSVTPAVATSTLPPAPQYVGAPPPTDTTVTPLVNAPTQVNYFYSSLSPYGSWIELPSYGWCWQPTVAVVNTGWRPYCHSGRWLYSDCGWYWHSDYSWGWAPFHYGRWHHHARRGWVWFPDSVWAPAWVTWRYTDGYCGWAPLPYGFHCGVGGSTFRGASVGVGFDFGLTSFHFSWVSHRNFAERAPVHHILAGDKTRDVYNNSKVINNIIVGNNNTIINNGIGFEKISAVSRTEIAKVSVRDLPAAPQKALKPDRVERDGSSLVVYRPHVGNQTVTTAPAAPTTRHDQELRKSNIPAPSFVAPAAVAGAAGVAALASTGAKPTALPSVGTPVQKRINERTPGANISSPTTPTSVAKPKLETAKTTTPVVGSPRSLETLAKPAMASAPTATKPIAPTPTIPLQNSGGVPQAKPINERGGEPVIAKNSSTPFQPATVVGTQPRYVGQPAAQSQPSPQVTTTPQTRITQQPNYQVPTPRPTYVAPQPVVRQPTYTPPPVQQYRPQPAPTYSAPRPEAPRPAQSYSPPPQRSVSTPAPASRGKNEK